MRQWKIRDSYRKLPMQKKLTISFSVPMIMICVVITMLCTPILANAYRKQVQYSMKQSCEQANNFILNRIENMYYIAQLLEESREINHVLTQEGFGRYNNMAEAYREFYAMNSAFRDIELAYSDYKIGLYIPDELAYSNNNYYFYPESVLKQRKDYEQIVEAVEAGKVYFAIVEEAHSSNPTILDSYITMFYSVKAQREGLEHTYISKIGILTDKISDILKSAGNTENNLLYLLDEAGQFLATSSEEAYYTLQEELPTQHVASWSRQQIGKEACFVLYQHIEGYQWQLFSVIPVEDLKKQTNFISIMMLMITLLLAIAVVVISHFLAKSYAGRLDYLRENMKKLENGELNTQFTIVERVEKSEDEVDEIYAGFYHMAQQLQHLMKAHYKLGKSVMSAELRALQAQINPHFLYNTLDLINWGALEYGADEVAGMARNLGQFYRLSLNHGKSAIQIGEELKHVEAFVNIENMHFPGAITLEIDVPEQIKEYACLNIILQPFVENAIMHGIAEHPDIIECTIKIWAYQEDTDIIFAIHDDGPGIEQERQAEILRESRQGENNGYGVKNINFRIKLCYGDKYGISYESMPEEGTTVYLRIPALTYEELNELLK